MTTSPTSTTPLLRVSSTTTPSKLESNDVNSKAIINSNSKSPFPKPLPALPLFGPLPTHPWISESCKWKAIDDRVRGGGSRSCLEVVDEVGEGEVLEEGVGEGDAGGRNERNQMVKFYGNLDTQTLGGAGFASQSHFFYDPTHSDSPSFSSSSLSLPRSSYKGLSLRILLFPTESSLDPEKKNRQRDSLPLSSSSLPLPTTFTLVLKCQVPKRRSDGKRESVLSFESSFDVSKLLSANSHIREKDNEKQTEGKGTGARGRGKEVDIEMNWEDFEPFYRGRKQPARKGELDTEDIKELSIMCRSNFAKQEGPFNLTLIHLYAIPTKQQKENGILLRFWIKIREVLGKAVLGLKKSMLFLFG